MSEKKNRNSDTPRLVLEHLTTANLRSALERRSASTANLQAVASRRPAAAATPVPAPAQQQAESPPASPQPVASSTSGESKT